MDGLAALDKQDRSWATLKKEKLPSSVMFSATRKWKVIERLQEVSFPTPKLHQYL